MKLKKIEQTSGNFCDGCYFLHLRRDWECGNRGEDEIDDHCEGNGKHYIFLEVEDEDKES